MADGVFNIAKGTVAYYSSLPAASDALIVIALKSSGLVSDATMQDYATVAAILAGASDEATNSGYARKTVTASVTVTVDNTNDWVTVDMPDQTWTAVASVGGAWGKLIVAYDNDTGGGTDANLIPLTFHDFSVTPSGLDVTAQLNAAGFYKAA